MGIGIVQTTTGTAVVAFIGLAAAVGCGGDDSATSEGAGGAAATGASGTGGGAGTSAATGGAGGSPQPSSLTCDPIACGPSNGKTTPVPVGSDLQAALAAAEQGDTLVLDAGATYSGHFSLPSKSGA